MAYADALNALGPVAYWRLGESLGSSTAVDETGNYNGTYGGSPVLEATGLLTDDTNTAVTLDGSSYVDAGTGIVVDHTSPFSLCFSVNVASYVTLATQTLLSIRWTSASLNFMVVTSNSSNNLFIGGYGGITLKTPSILNAGTNYHVVITYDGVSPNTGSSYKIYLNGSSQSISQGPVAQQTLSNTYLGANNVGASGLDGTLDDVGIFNYELNQTQVTTLYTESITPTGPLIEPIPNNIVTDVAANEDFDTWIAKFNTYKNALYDKSELLNDLTDNEKLQLLTNINIQKDVRDRTSLIIAATPKRHFLEDN